ncbi:hypothetical protein GCM10010517_32140 [Streptosporangium fragile]|uniref:Uncharacterized protein n=1 Tax=Streptosporangium fragile TaxID=46186 RepID=A0ABN3VXT9_9ACTN
MLVVSVATGDCAGGAIKVPFFLLTVGPAGSPGCGSPGGAASRIPGRDAPARHRARRAADRDNRSDLGFPGFTGAAALPFAPFPEMVTHGETVAAQRRSEADHLILGGFRNKD